MAEEYPYEEQELETLQEDAREDEIEGQIETQKEIQDEVYTESAYRKEDLYSLFWKVVKTQESSKVGNLDKTELGALNISVRDCQRIALLAIKLGHPGFAAFFKFQGEIVLATSCSKTGWLQELFVTARKLKGRETKIRNLTQPIPPRRRRWGT